MVTPWLDDGDVRPVWLTRQQRDAMQGASKRWPLLADAADAWDKAPAIDACEPRSWPFAPGDQIHRLVPDPDEST